MELPNPGSYRAQQNGKVIVRMEETGSLMAYIPYALVGSAFMGEHMLCLGAKDGTPQKKNVLAFAQTFPTWDFTPSDIEMPAEGEEVPQFDLADCYHDDSYTPEGAESPQIQFKASWFNVVGGGRKQPMTADERKAATTRWGSKLRALMTSGAKAATKKPVAPAEDTAEEQQELASARKAAPAPAKKPVSSGPPGRKSTAATDRTSTQEEVWDAWLKVEDGKDEDEKAQGYYDACDSVVEDSSADPKLLDTPAKWGKVADALGV